MELSRRTVLRYGLTTTGAIALRSWPTAAFAGPGSIAPTADQFDADVPTAWFDLSLALIQTTPGFSPPVASRAFAYAAVALYEALTPGMPDHRSLSGQLSGLADVPQAGRNTAYHWPTVANSSLATILRSLFPTAATQTREAIDGLEAGLAAGYRPGLPPGVFRRSVERGQQVAAAVFEWSTTDGGHEGYLRNFPPSYVPPAGPGLWVPTPPGFLLALQPFWGSCRTFAMVSGADCPAGDHTPHSEDSTSLFYEQAIEVYETVNDLTPEQREIALFWSDDPGRTPTPPGHSVSILTQVIRQTASSLEEAAEAYVKVGLAVADAFICCWNTKYRDNLLRPVTYIGALIDPAWTPLLVTPPFPEYTSGHSVQSSAAAEVLTKMFGQMPFTDHTHDDRGLAPRSFGSFIQAAEEAAISRLYGGIHFRPAIENGLVQGWCIGEAVDALTFRA
jgi:hypothetical protein